MTRSEELMALEISLLLDMGRRYGQLVKKSGPDRERAEASKRARVEDARMDRDFQKVIAVDFDGCLCHSEWPEIGPPAEGVLLRLREEQQRGAKIVLWTCRDGELLEQAVAWCAERGITFDAVNEQIPELKGTFGNDSRKIFASEYWDDRAVRMSFQECWRQEILEDAVKTWGMRAQEDMLLEEMSELAKAVLKLRREKREQMVPYAISAIRDEMADVQIMLDQMKIMYGEVDNFERDKLKRLLERLEEAHAEGQPGDSR